MRRIAIIPARGGSKRIPNKNVRDFCGKPMIAHIIEAASESGLFEVIHVSTDSEAIANVAQQLGFPPAFLRPAVLADDFTPIMPVLKYVTEVFEKSGQIFDQVWMLMACAPLIAACDLVAADKLFLESDGKSPLLAVTEYSVPIEWAFRREDDGHLVPVHPGSFSLRSQDIEKKYFDAGSFSIFPTYAVQSSKGAGSDQGFIGYILPKGTAIDIDDERDWILAEAIYSRIRGVS